MAKAYIVYNPTAGYFPCYFLLMKAIRIFQDKNWDLNVIHSKSGSHIKQLAYQASNEGADVFFVVGGDGTVNNALPGLIHSETALGVFPTGTGNVLAKILGLPELKPNKLNALSQVAKMYQHSVSRKVDIGMCNGTPFILFSGIGLTSTVIEKMEPRNYLNRIFPELQYAIMTLISFAKWRGMNIRVVEDGNVIEGHYHIGVACNVKLYAGGLLTVSPNSLIDDGLLELFLFKYENIYDLLSVVWDAYNSREMNSDKILKLVFKKIKIESHIPLPIHVDGEPLKRCSNVQLEVKHYALRILVPNCTVSEPMGQNRVKK